MNPAPSRLTPESALRLLKHASDQDPGAAVQKRVAARLEHSLAAGLVPTTASMPAAGHSTSSTSSMTLGPLVVGPKVLLGVTLLVGVGVGISVDRLVISEAMRTRALAAEAAIASRPAVVMAAVPLDGATSTDALPTMRAEDLPKLPAAAPKRAAAEAAFKQAVTSLSPERAPESPRASSLEPQDLSRQSGLREQQALLDRARLALANGRHELCLAAIAAHQSRFPQSLLAEERDALTIKALAATGDLSSARERLVAFLANYPRSLLIPSLETTVGETR